MSDVYLGLGSNLGNSVSLLNSALTQLHAESNIQLIKVSSFYASKPLDNKDQANYVNAVAKIHTEYTPHDLLIVLHDIEARHGRQRTGEHWASRTLDIDILLFDNLILNDDVLCIPHAGMLARDFVLYPLHEISPDIEIPSFGPINKALSRCENRGLEKLNENDS